MGQRARGALLVLLTLAAAGCGRRAAEPEPVVPDPDMVTAAPEPAEPFVAVDSFGPAYLRDPLDSRTDIPVMDSAMVRELFGPFLDMPHPRFMDGDWEWDFAHSPHLWYRLDDHPLIRRVLPGTKVYIVTDELSRLPPKCPPHVADVVGFTCRLLAVRNGYYYNMPGDLPQLLYDSELALDEADVSRWAPLVLLFEEAAEELRPWATGADVSAAITRERRAVLRGERPLVPAMQLGEVEVDTVWEHLRVNEEEEVPNSTVVVSVDYSASGASVRATIGTFRMSTKRGLLILPAGIRRPGEPYAPFGRDTPRPRSEDP